MKILIQNGRLIDPATQLDRVADIAIAAGQIVAIGEIPANTPIEVRVAPADAARAREIVEAWQRAPIDDAAFDHPGWTGDPRAALLNNGAPL